MTYIINPMWFYWMHVLENARVVLGVAIVSCIVAAAISAGLWADECISGQKLKTLETTFLIIIAVCCLLFPFLPSKETMIEMMVAKYATVENAEMTVEAIKNLIDYIIEAVKST